MLLVLRCAVSNSRWPYLAARNEPCAYAREYIKLLCKLSREKETVDVASHECLLIRNLVEGMSAEAASRAIEGTGGKRGLFHCQ